MVTEKNPKRCGNKRERKEQKTRRNCCYLADSYVVRNVVGFCVRSINVGNAYCQSELLQMAVDSAAIYLASSSIKFMSKYQLYSYLCPFC